MESASESSVQSMLFVIHEDLRLYSDVAIDFPFQLVLSIREIDQGIVVFLVVQPIQSLDNTAGFPCISV